MLRAYVFDIQPEIVMICEAGTHSGITDAYLALSGYNLVVRADGKDTTDGWCRGLLIWAKEGVKAGRYESLYIKDMVECEGITIPWGVNGSVLTLLLAYRPLRLDILVGWLIMDLVKSYVTCWQESGVRFSYVETSTTVGLTGTGSMLLVLQKEEY